MSTEPASATATSPGVISRKLGPPPAPERFVERTRLDAHLDELIGSRRVVVVAASAGAGKTTAVLSACRGLDRPNAWLAVDRTDQAPGRLVIYLEAAIGRVLPHTAGIATQALAAGVQHPEATGLLVDAVGPLVMVLDDLERLADSAEAWAVVEAFVRYAPAAVTTVLVSRRDIPVSLCELPLPPATVAVGDAELAFTAAEAGDALAGGDGSQVDESNLDEILRATGGWVAGVLFRASAATAADPASESGLATYLSTRVLAELQQADRDFLVRTAVLDEVDVESATALGVENAGQRLSSLNSTHLPVTWGSDGLSMRCHALFREHLLALLGRRNPGELRNLQLTKARLLAQQGHDEEAVEVLLRWGAPDEALAPAQRAIAGVIERLDFAVAERWLAALEPVRIHAHELHLAELLISVGRGDFARGARVGDRLQAASQRERFVSESNQAAGLLAYCYGEVGRLAESRAIVELAGEGPSTDVLRYTERLSSGMSDRPRPAPTGGPLDALLLAVDYGLGRFEHTVLETASRWTNATHMPQRIAALQASGRIEEALSLYAEASRSGVVEGGFAAYVGVDLLVDAGRREEALAAFDEGRAFLERSASRYRLLLSWIALARLRLRLDRDPGAALETLEAVKQDLDAFPVLFIREAWGTWTGCALLLFGRDEDARDELLAMVDSMVEGDRLLNLPTAAVYLSEALWRAGDELGADKAADLALAAARRQGSNHLLLQALADFPAVVSRGIDAEAETDSRWHELGRTLVARGTPLEVPLGFQLELRDIGRPALLVDGELRRPRIAKAYELLAYLIQHGGTATRDELLDALFDSRDDDSTRAYLRQAINQLARSLPDPDALLSTGGVVRLSPSARTTTTSRRAELRLDEARVQHGAVRLATTAEAISILDRGEYFEGSNDAWIEDRRRELALLVTAARSEAARLAFEEGRHLEALALNERVLADDPIREDTWRLQMQVKGALGDDAGVLAAFSDCARALGAIGADPAPSTRQLLERLRR